MSLTPLVNTSYVVKKNGPLLRWCFQRWERAEWSEKKFDAYAAYLRIYRGSPKIYAPVERILFLQHIGSAIGSSWLVCAVLLAISGLIAGKYRILEISGVPGALSLLLLLTSQLQGMQLHLTLFRLEDERTKRRAQRESKGQSALSPESNPRQDQARARARAVASAAEAIRAAAGDGDAETGRGGLSCPDVMPHSA
jgi:hypothetical protein